MDASIEVVDVSGDARQQWPHEAPHHRARPEGTAPDWAEILDRRGAEGPRFVAIYSTRKVGPTRLLTSPEIEILREQVSLLRNEVHNLSLALAATQGPAVEPAAIDPRLKWCRENAAVLGNLTDTFAAIATGRGMVASAPSPGEFRVK